MRHLLAILTIALAFTASTASAINYYDYYGSATVETTTLTVQPDPNNPYWTATVQQETNNYGEYQVIRTSYPYQPLVNHDSLYKIRITGESVDLYITDWIDNIGDSRQEDSLKDKGITKYGYYYVNSDKEAGITDLASATPFEIEKSPWNDNYVTRYGYYLGTFSAGDEIEIYMQDSNGGSVKSNSTQWNGGGYGEGVYEVDKLALYKTGNEAAARKAMPLAMLDTGNGHRVFYGIYGEATGGGSGPVGTPLPGGPAIVLVSGLFALGFWYVRRRKPIAA